MPRVRRPVTPVSAPALLQLMWLASPALPVGGFSYSEGLESAVDTALVGDEASAQRWLVDQLRLGLARADLPTVARALAAWRRGDSAHVEALNGWFAFADVPAHCTRKLSAVLCERLDLNGLLSRLGTPAPARVAPAHEAALAEAA